MYMACMHDSYIWFRVPGFAGPLSLSLDGMGLRVRCHSPPSPRWYGSQDSGLLQGTLFASLRFNALRFAYCLLHCIGRGRRLSALARTTTITTTTSTGGKGNSIPIEGWREERPITIGGRAAEVKPWTIYSPCVLSIDMAPTYDP